MGKPMGNGQSGRMARLIVGSLLYQCVWFAAVYFAGSPDLHGLGVSLAGGCILLQWLIWRELRLRILAMAFVAALTGLVLDSLLSLCGVFDLTRHVMPDPLTPLWLLGLWAGFGVYIAVGLEGMYSRLRLAALGGLIGGPLAYRGGVPFGAVKLGDPAWLSMLVIGIAWAVVFAMLVWVAGRLHRWQADSAPTGSAALRGLTRTLHVFPALLMAGVLWCCSAGPAAALQGDASLYVASKRVGEVDLVLRGVGRLRRYMINGCDIALFTPPLTTRATLLKGDPKALEFVYYRRITGPQFGVAAEEILKRNTTAEEYRKFQAEIRTMSGFFKTVDAGDRYLLWFAPGVGTVLELNGQRLGVIAEPGFADVYFRIWLGSDPIDKRLWQGMMEKVPSGGSK